MLTQKRGKPYLDAARNWVNSRFPHFSNKMHPDFQLDDYTPKLTLVSKPDLSLNGAPIDAHVITTGSIELMEVHFLRFLAKSRNARLALIIHEMVEAYGVESDVFSGYPYARPEHEYAEFIEAHFRREVGLPSCELALAEVEYQRMRLLDQLFRIPLPSYQHIGSRLYDFIVQNGITVIDVDSIPQFLARCGLR